MAARALGQNVVRDPSAMSNASTHEAVKVKRVATVYDAVAGRVSAGGFISDVPIISSGRDTASSSSLAVSPEAVLFRRKSAPVRYEESDFYFASDALSPGALPDSDLLKALHCYTSDFYSRATSDGGRVDWRSNDETAMLALGILMEEASRESLGKTGDLVFTEGEWEEENKTSHRTATAPGPNVVRKSAAATRSGHTRRAKRRKLGLEGTEEIRD